MGYKDYIQAHDGFFVQYDCNRKTKLPAGHYEVIYNQEMDQLIFEQINFNHDELLELPSNEFQTIVSQIDTFLTKETKDLFKQYGFIYKRAILMFGVPGTGKTCLVNRISEKVVREGGIVLFNPDPSILPKAYKALDDIQPETNVVVVFEELDQLVKTYEGDLLSLLDGEIQRENVIYLATTNYVNKIPARIMRPGRFSTVIEIAYPDKKSREFYLNEKMGKYTTKKEIKDWVKRTDGLSIDELKELVLSTKCLQIKFDEVLLRIRKTKELCAVEPPKHNMFGTEYDEWEPNGGMKTARNMINRLTEIRKE